MKLSQSIILEGGQALPIASDVPLAQAVHVVPAGVPLEPAPRPPTAVDPTAKLILLQQPQVAAWAWGGCHGGAVTLDSWGMEQFSFFIW